MLKRLNKNLIKIFSHLKHPVGVNCLDCGFLSLGEGELNPAERIQLHVRGTAGCPPLEVISCSKQLWIEYDLTYCGTDADGIFIELEKQRRDCKGFIRYKSGWSPSKHDEILLKRMDIKEKLFIAVIGAVLAFIVQWLVKRI